MAGAADLIREATKHVGMGEPNKIQGWYRNRNGSAYNGNFAWCDAFVTYCAYMSGTYKAVCPKGDRAYTVSHAGDFQKLGQWYTGTVANINRAQPGDIVFFDWGGSDNIGSIDHVGIVIEALGNGNVRTIEGNTSDKCLIKTRHANVLAGYGRPRFDMVETPPVPAPPPYVPPSPIPVPPYVPPRPTPKPPRPIPGLPPGIPPIFIPPDNDEDYDDGDYDPNDPPEEDPNSPPMPWPVPSPRPQPAPPSRPPTEDRSGVLRNGSMGESVKLLQEVLNATGANPALEPDGDFGPLTQQAVVNYQTRYNLSANGVVDVSVAIFMARKLLDN